MILSSASFLAAGKTFESTIAPAPVEMMKFHSVLGDARWKTTVVSSTASVFTLASRLAGPEGSLILRTRSKENFTSVAVSGSPFENFRPGLSLQVQVLKSAEGSQDSAASGTFFSVVGSTLSSVW